MIRWLTVSRGQGFESSIVILPGYDATSNLVTRVVVSIPRPVAQSKLLDYKGVFFS